MFTKIKSRNSAPCWLFIMRIKRCFQETGNDDIKGSHLDQHIRRWQDLVNYVLNLRVGRGFLSRWATTSFSARTPFHRTGCTELWEVKRVKCTLVQALRLCTGRTAHRGSRGIALPFLDHDTRRGWGVSVTPRPLFYPGKDPVPILQEAGWAPGPVWTGAENLASTGIRSQDHQARSQSLYRLSYPGPWTMRSDA